MCKSVISGRDKRKEKAAYFSKQGVISRPETQARNNHTPPSWFKRLKWDHKNTNFPIASLRSFSVWDLVSNRKQPPPKKVIIQLYQDL